MLVTLQFFHPLQSHSDRSSEGMGMLRSHCHVLAPSSLAGTTKGSASFVVWDSMAYRAWSSMTSTALASIRGTSSILHTSRASVSPRQLLQQSYPSARSMASKVGFYSPLAMKWWRLSRRRVRISHSSFAFPPRNGTRLNMRGTRGICIKF